MSQGDMGNMRLQQQPIEAPHLVEYFYNKYPKIGMSQPDIEVVFRFAKWMADQLSENRPIRTFPADANVGLVLADNQQLLVSRAIEEIKGSMQAKPLGEAQRQGVPDVYANQGAVPVTGNAQRKPGQQDYSQNTQTVFERKGGVGENKTTPTKVEKLDQPHEYPRKL